MMDGDSRRKEECERVGDLPRHRRAAPLLRQRLPLLLILLTPLVVMLVSLAIYTWGRSWVDVGVTSKGLLLTAPVQLSDLGIVTAAPGRWQAILVFVATCDESCRQTAVAVERLPILLGRDAGRIHRLLVAPRQLAALENVFAPRYWQVGILDTRTLRTALLAYGVPAEQLPHFTLLADPLGNVVSFYRPGEIGALLEDLRKLLRNSHIG